MDRQAKNQRIKETLIATKTRHSNMDVKTFEVKVVGSKLSHEQKNQINQYFKEAKWLRNHFLADLDNADYKTNVVNIKVKNSVETRVSHGSLISRAALNQIANRQKSGAEMRK